MSGLTEDRKDQLAARALSRLSEPQLPDGFAARIAARATSAQQTPATSRDTIAANEAELLPAADRTPLDPARPLRWPRYVAASAAALAVATVGVLAVGAGPQGQRPSEVARDNHPARAPQATPERSVEIADVARSRGAPPPVPATAGKAEPVMQLPVGVASQPDELEGADEPGEVRAQEAVAVKEERLVQIGPPNGPLDAGGSRPVYGPPAPQGLGIAGSVNGVPSLPGEMGSTGRTARGSSPGSPSGGGSTMPGPATPRGSGPRI